MPQLDITTFFFQEFWVICSFFFAVSFFFYNIYHLLGLEFKLKSKKFRFIFNLIFFFNYSNINFFTKNLKKKFNFFKIFII